MRQYGLNVRDLEYSWKVEQNPCCAEIEEYVRDTNPPPALNTNCPQRCFRHRHARTHELDDKPAVDKYELLVEIVSQERRVSVSFIQRRLRVGYNEAVRYRERLVADGVVGVRNVARPEYEVLIGKE